MNSRNLILGGAQFGNGYGRHVKTPKLSEFDLEELLYLAKNHGVHEIDLAQNYESAIDNLASVTNSKDFKYTTKIQFVENLEPKILGDLRDDLVKLQISSFQNVLIHNWASLSAENRMLAARFLQSLLDLGISSEVGVSVYDLTELDFIDWVPGTIQAPLNFYNREFLKSDSVLELIELGTTFVARSIFHQGLLLNPELSIKFPQLGLFNSYCSENHLSCLEGALSVYDTQSVFQSMTVGVANASQLGEILGVRNIIPSQLAIPDLQLTDLDFTDPRRW
jgi:aryl-alcohol dehydrogenase-like predicted oxidoreductase